jgi:hypothetical protein
VGGKAKEKLVDLRERAMALCETVNALGLDTTPDDFDHEKAHTLTTMYASDPATASSAVSTREAGSLTPASIVLAGSILDEFGQIVVRDAQRIRHLVTNKLLLESDNPDPRIRLKALDLLGKISDVGLFTEKREVTHVHKSTDELRHELRNKLKDMGAAVIDNGQDDETSSLTIDQIEEDADL